MKFFASATLAIMLGIMGPVPRTHAAVTTYNVNGGANAAVPSGMTWQSTSGSAPTVSSSSWQSTNSNGGANAAAPSGMTWQSTSGSAPTVSSSSWQSTNSNGGANAAIPSGMTWQSSSGSVAPAVTVAPVSSWSWKSTNSNGGPAAATFDLPNAGNLPNSCPFVVEYTSSGGKMGGGPITWTSFSSSSAGSPGSVSGNMDGGSSSNTGGGSKTIAVNTNYPGSGGMVGSGGSGIGVSGGSNGRGASAYASVYAIYAVSAASHSTTASATAGGISALLSDGTFGGGGGLFG